MLALGLWVQMLDLSDKLGKIRIKRNNLMAKIDYLKVFPYIIIKECLKIRGFKTINTLARTLSSTKTLPKRARKRRVLHTTNLLV